MAHVIPSRSSRSGSPRRLDLLAAVAALSALLCHGCQGGDDHPEAALELTGIIPRSAVEPIRINDDLRVVFNEVLDPSSITSQSVRLVNEATGRPAKGRWLIEGRELRFLPRGPLRADLMDGGFQPGASYVLTMAGFPQLSGPRSERGLGLRYSIRHSFTVVSIPGGGVQEPPLSNGAEPRLLRDASPDRGARVELRPEDEGSSDGTPLAWDAKLLLACAEPIDPRGFRPGDFEVRELLYGQEAALGALELGARAVGVRSIELLRNEDEDVPDTTVGAAAILRVTFDENLPLNDVSSGAFELRLKPGAQPGGGLVDFSGTPVFRGRIPFFAARRDAFLPERDGSYEIEFLNAQDFAPLLDPASDGTALWSDSGRLEVRYPRAAGDGSGGRQVLGAEFDGADLHATRISIPAGVETRLTAPGLVVLRAQGRLDVDGELLRSLPSGASPEPMWDKDRVANSLGTLSLTDWLASARVRDAPWTVLIAGGDLVVRGKISVETPLLLVAGGMIRGVGEPGAAPNQIWLLGEGGFASMPHHTNAEASTNSTPPLVIDEPLCNQLVEPLTFVAISSEVPKGVAPARWGTPQILGSSGAGGSYLVQFLGPDRFASGGADSSTEEWLRRAIPHDEPKDVLLEAGQVDGVGGRVRLRVQLQLRPPLLPLNPGPWAPPFVDRVRLFWTPDPR